MGQLYVEKTASEFPWSGEFPLEAAAEKSVGKARVRF